MIAIVYRWRIVPELNEQFVTAWTAITDLLKEQGALGSALFDADDGTVVAIARWPDRATRTASSARHADPVLYDRMIEAIAEDLGETILDERLNFWDR